MLLTNMLGGVFLPNELIMYEGLESMRKICAICSGLLLCTLGVQAHAKSRLEEKAYNKCHHAVYGRGELQVKGDVTVVEGEVPLSLVGPKGNLAFNEGAFIIKHTGSYVIDYFIKTFASGIAAPTTDMAVSVNGVLKGYRMIWPFVAFDQSGTIFEGNGKIIENLRKGDRVSLVVAKIPSFLPLSPLLYVNFAYRGGNESTPADIAAYLTIVKVE